MQPVDRQLEAALADVEGSSKSGIFNAIRTYLQLVGAFTGPLIAAGGQQEASPVLIKRSTVRRCASARSGSQKT